MPDTADHSPVQLTLTLATQILALFNDCGASKLEQQAAIKIVDALLVVGPASYSVQSAAIAEARRAAE